MFRVELVIIVVVERKKQVATEKLRERTEKQIVVGGEKPRDPCVSIGGSELVVVDCRSNNSPRVTLGPRMS